MRYVTRDGVALEVGRVDRRLLDAAYIPAPVPPTRSVESWGGVSEALPDYNDPTYRTQMLAYRLRMWREQLDTLADGVELPTDTSAIDAQLQALAEIITLPNDRKSAFLRYGLSDSDRNALVAEILYQSTVTERGVQEAVERFAYRWRDKPLMTWGVPMSYGERGQRGAEWRTAMRSGLTWGQFCELTGPEQSEHVAFWMLEDRINYLLQT